MPTKARPRQARVTLNERAKDAGPERPRAVLGSIVLKGPRPAIDFIHDDLPDRGHDSARD